MTYLLTIDPGMSTGITLGRYAPDAAYERLGFWQVEGGLKGFYRWLLDHYWEQDPESAGMAFGGATWEFPYVPAFYARDTVVVCEKFVPLPAPRTFKTAELEPIRIEGAVEVLLGDVVWQRAAMMVLAGGDTPAKRKRASDDVLRAGGLWVTGMKDLGMKDANDVISAQKHALAYLRSIKHQPTIEKYLLNEE